MMKLMCILTQYTDADANLDIVDTANLDIDIVDTASLEIDINIVDTANLDIVDTASLKSAKEISIKDQGRDQSLQMFVYILYFVSSSSFCKVIIILYRHHHFVQHNSFHQYSI